MSISMDVGLETRNIPMEALDDVLGDFGMLGDVLIYVLFCFPDEPDSPKQPWELIEGFSDIRVEDESILIPDLQRADLSPEERAEIEWHPPARIADAARRLALVTCH